MNTERYTELFNHDTLATLFPPDRADAFFDALFGDASEGAYDIKLAFREYAPDKRELLFDLELHQRPGKCLACNLTYGLPEVFTRHPVIDIKGVVQGIENLLGGAHCAGWRLHPTMERSRGLHVIPLVLSFEKALPA